MGGEKTNTDRFKAFLQTRPAITWSRLEKEAGVRHDLLKEWMAGKVKMADKHYLKLLFKAQKYSDDPWMVDAAQDLYTRMEKEDKLKNLKFK